MTAATTACMISTRAWKALSLKSGYILGLGPLVKSNEFYLAVNSWEIMDKLIMCGEIIDPGRAQHGHIFL